LSDDDNSIKLTSSDENDYNDVSDTDLWCGVLENIPDFTFDGSRSGIKIDVQETALNNSF